MSVKTITNARIVTPTTEFVGTLRCENGIIVALDDRLTSTLGADDWAGDYCLPGLVELHTDNLEKHLEPRPGVRWPPLSALLIHDSQIASSGITTVLDALFIGDLYHNTVRAEGLAAARAAVTQGAAAGVLRAEHLLHLRCELACDNMLEVALPLLPDPMVRLLSIMDHTPGQRQWTHIDKFKQYMQGGQTWTDAHTQAEVARLQAMQARNAVVNRREILRLAAERGLALASHDDTLPEHVDEAHANGIGISEFPTSQAAAERARERGLAIVLGAPNMVRGGSHSGNASVLDLARLGLLDCMSSDYVPISLLHSVFLLRDRAGWDLPSAARTASLNAARALGLSDRGELTVSKRADFVRVRELKQIPVPLGTWRMGQRVA